MLGNHLKWLKDETKLVSNGEVSPLEAARRRKPSLQFKISIALVILAIVMLSIDARHPTFWGVLVFGGCVQIMFDLYRIFRSKN